MLNRIGNRRDKKEVNSLFFGILVWNIEGLRKIPYWYKLSKEITQYILRQ